MIDTSLVKGREWRSSDRWPDGGWLIVRVDGRSFTKLTAAQGYERPFDEKFHRVMNVVSRTLLRDSNGLLATTHSDEVSILLSPTWSSFNRRNDKICSTMAGLASAAFTMETDRIATFDARVSVAINVEQVAQYFVWRAQDAHRNALYSHCHWKLIDQGFTPRAAASQLRNRGVSEQNEFLFSSGVNFNDLPAWQKRETLTSWKVVSKEGFNPITNEAVFAYRNRMTSEVLPSSYEETAARITELCGV